MFRALILLYCLVSCSWVQAGQYWQKDERKVLAAAEEANRPIVAIFLGKRDCPWSQKLRQEVIENSFFQNTVGGEAILWQVSVEGEEGDKELREKYRVKVCPLILMLDPRGKEFARLEYVPLDAAGYAAEINGLIDHFQELCLALENEKDSAFDEENWQELYQKAKKFSASCFSQVILERGLRHETGTFFHVEKFASLLENHKRKHPLVRKAKKQLLELDPDNQFGTHFKLAVLSFNKILSCPKQDDGVEKPISPLLKFVQRFGKTDRENLWKAELMIAEYFFTKNLIKKAIEHAEASYAAAPSAEKQKIAESINYMKRSACGFEF